MLDILAQKANYCISYTKKKIDACKPLILKVHSSVVVWLCRTSNNTVLHPVVLAQLNRAALRPGVPLHWFHLNFTPYRFAWLRIIKSELQPFCAPSQDCITSQMYILFWNSCGAVRASDCVWANARQENVEENHQIDACICVWCNRWSRSLHL